MDLLMKTSVSLFGWNSIFPVQNANRAVAGIHWAVKYFYFLSNLIGALACYISCLEKFL